MAVTQLQGGCTWYPIRSGEVCPICNSKNGRCGYMVNQNNDVVMYRCKYVESNRPSKDGWYIHLASNLNNNFSNKIKHIRDYKIEPITDELLNLWDKVYREFRKQFTAINGSPLYSNHKKNLIERGITEDLIDNIGCFSIPNNKQVSYEFSCTTRTAIIHSLLKHFKPESLIKVPGFQKMTAHERDFVVFKNSIFNKESRKFIDMDGYFIPYFDYLNRLVGMQYRLTNPIIDDEGKEIRYLWYSSKKNTCGSPIDFHIPKKLNIKDSILITEGGLKAKIASEIIGIKSLAEAGVSNYRRLIKELQLIEEHENKRYKVLLALDMDKYSNKDVLASEINTVAMLKSLGYSVTILEWNIADGKGIDDKLKSSGQNDFRYLTI